MPPSLLPHTNPLDQRGGPELVRRCKSQKQHQLRLPDPLQIKKKKSKSPRSTGSREPQTLAVHRAPQRARAALAGSALTLRSSRSPKEKVQGRNFSLLVVLTPPTAFTSASFLVLLPSFLPLCAFSSSARLPVPNALRPPSSNRKKKKSKTQRTNARKWKEKKAVSCKEEKVLIG